MKYRLLKVAYQAGLVALITLCLMGCTTPEGPPNVLFIAVDDLRPELGAYGKNHIHSPHIDALAADGALFTRHFVAVPTCGASRYALLTGQYPRSTEQLSNQAFVLAQRDSAKFPMPKTFLEALREHGYYTVGIGKISHYPDGKVYDYLATPEDAPWELPQSWDEMLFDEGKWGTAWNAFFGYADGTNRNTLDKQVKPYESADVPDAGYPDGLTTQLALRKLDELKDRDQPFFLGVGFFKPHLPFNAPKKYWDLYDRDSLPLSPAPDLPREAGRASLHGSGEFNQYALGEEKASLDASLSDPYARTLRHAYFACISYTDAQIGRVLAKLEDLDLADNTVVVLWGDHGWHLGDLRVWGKHTCFDWALHSPLIIRDPRRPSNRRIEEVVSTVDLYPTLMDLCGLPAPDHLDGRSLTGLLEGQPAEDWRNEAFSYYRRGVSLRTDRYRITHYARTQMPQVELYDLQGDPFEQVNIAADHPAVVDSLMRLLVERPSPYEAAELR